MVQLRKIIGDRIIFRLGGAFICGLLLGFLAHKIGAQLQNLLPFLLFPLLTGILGAFTVNARSQHPYALTLGTGLVSWLGISAYLLIATGQSSVASCTASNCNTTSVLSSLLDVYLLIGFVLVTLGALSTSLLIRSLHRAEKTST